MSCANDGRAHPALGRCPAVSDGRRLRLSPGLRFGPFALGERLGAGGHGSVYRAVVESALPYVAAGEVVAVKVLEAPAVSRTARSESMVRSVALRHPNLECLLGVEELRHEGQSLQVLVSECIEGLSLRAWLDQHGALGEERGRSLGRQLAAALATIHGAGLVHRDVKPANIMITADFDVRLIDLGIAVTLDELERDEHLRPEAPGELVGTPAYASPEQCDGMRLGPSTDLYSLGVVLHEAMTGANPFCAATAEAVAQRHREWVPERLGEVVEGCSPMFEEVVATLLDKELERRFGSAVELGEVLEQGTASGWWSERAFVARASGARAVLRRLGVGCDSQFIGRRDEVTRLRQAVRGQGSDAGGCFVIEGEGGIGKSRLLRELVVDLIGDSSAVTVLFGGYSPVVGASEAGALEQALSAAFEPPELDEMLARHLAAVSLLIEPFASYLRAGSLTELGKLGRSTVKQAFARVARGLAAQGRLVWLVDDLHYAEADQVDAVLELAAIAAEAGFTLLISTRPG